MVPLIVISLKRKDFCNYIQLFKWAYQAPNFYKKLGFECVGVVNKWIDNYDAVFFKNSYNKTFLILDSSLQIVQ